MAVARELIEAHPADPRGYIDLGIILARGEILRGHAPYLKQD